MSRRVRTRQNADAARSGRDDTRQGWLIMWKRWAVSQLPGGTPREVRVQVRAAVERALGRFGLADDDEEIRDVLFMVLEDAVDDMRAETDRAAHEERKRETLGKTALLLRVALRSFPKADVAAMLKQPGYSLVSLKHGLRRDLEQHLTGRETWEEVMDRVVAWVDCRLAEQPRVLRALAKGAGWATVMGTIALQDPNVREAAVRGLTKARDKASELWARWTKPDRPPAGS